MSLLLHPNRLSIGKAIALTKYNLHEQGQSFIPADITFRRYAKWFKDNNYDKWILARDGEKALSDKVEPYIKRDASLLEVGDILVADGHKLAFQVINPFTGKPCRATLVALLTIKDLVSQDLTDYIQNLELKLFSQDHITREQKLLKDFLKNFKKDLKSCCQVISEAAFKINLHI